MPGDKKVAWLPAGSNCQSLQVLTDKNVPTPPSPMKQNSWKHQRSGEKKVTLLSPEKFQPLETQREKKVAKSQSPVKHKHQPSIMQRDKNVATLSSSVMQKSHPLHNFELPRLSWAKGNTINHVRGRSNQVSSPSSSLKRPLKRRKITLVPKQRALSQIPLISESLREGSPARGLEREEAASLPSGLSETLETSIQNLATNVLSDLGLNSEKEDEKSAGGSNEMNGKVYTRVRRKDKKIEEVQGEEEKETSVNKVNGIEKKLDTTGLETDDDQFTAKTWNLRPRKPLNKSSNTTPNGKTASSKVGGGGVSQENTAKGSKVRKEKEKMVSNFSIALTHKDIEDDFFILTGSKPSKRPKKRAKAVQKQLDNVFPGLWLSSITLDDYKVDDHSKG